MSVDLDGVFEHSPSLLFVADAEGTLLRHSKVLADQLGQLPDHPSLTALAGPEDRSNVAAFLAELADSKETVNRVLRLSKSDGQAISFRCLARRAPDGNIYAQLENLDRAPELATITRVEQTLFRALMDTLEIVLWAIDRDGKFVFQDGKALATAGLRPSQFVGMDIKDLYPTDTLRPILDALEGTPSMFPSEAHGVHWNTWNIPLRTRGGDVDLVAGLSVDVSSTVRTKLELERRLETIQSQQRAIYELSAPIINVWDSVLTVPLIGVLDNMRANELIERLLGAASRSSTRFVILDLTGVDALDTSIAGHLLRLLRSLRLLGVEGLVTGISPQVSQTMVGLGVELEDVRTFRSLRESLRYCMRAMYEESSSSAS